MTSGNQVVRAYHGTDHAAAESIIRDGFKASNNEYDWLGDGVYFFQDSPQRAWDWASERHAATAAVIGADIRLVDCLDLLDPRWARNLADWYDLYVQKIKGAGGVMPVQAGKAHRLDREVINYAVGVLGERGITIACVRGAFREGRPVFPGSHIFDLAHVQIAVRDCPRCVERRWVETQPVL